MSQFQSEYYTFYSPLILFVGMCITTTCNYISDCVGTLQMVYLSSMYKPLVTLVRKPLITNVQTIINAGSMYIHVSMIYNVSLWDSVTFFKGHLNRICTFTWSGARSPEVVK